VLVDCRGLESALKALRVSVEAVRMLMEALRCFSGRERLEGVPVKRTCRKNWYEKGLKSF
jgi:hypothetical protein